MAGMGIALADMILNQGTTSTNPGYKTYTVQRGDSLSLIASRLLGDAGRWKEIFNINPSISDPNVIEVGQVLNIPASAVASSTDPAKSVTTSPRTTALNVDSVAASEPGFLSSPMVLVGAAGVSLLIILMATGKKASSSA